MQVKSKRLFFIDVMRAWAILMMLQGHFIDGLLAASYRNPDNIFYNIWLYFRGITAPVFFTVSGFIFTYLLIRGNAKGLKNPRVEKGIKRGLQLVFIGYLLRSNVFGLFKGEIYNTFFLVDVLHCIGLSLIGIVGVYLLTHKVHRLVFPTLLVSITVLLFMFEPIYSQYSYSFLPQSIANYFTKTNGSIFTIIPWFGYAGFGGFMAVLFTRFKEAKHLYTVAILSSILIGLGLIFYSSPIFMLISEYTGIALFTAIYSNNYLFIRLGDVLVIFAIFMLLRSLMEQKLLFKIGQNTLSIYVIHFILLYGSFTGLGIYRFLHHQLAPSAAIGGAVLFILVCTTLALLYDKHSAAIQLNLGTIVRYTIAKLDEGQQLLIKIAKTYFFKFRLFCLKLFRLAKN